MTTPPSATAEQAAGAARDFRLRMAVIDQRTERALDATRDRHGATIDPDAAVMARGQRNRAAVEAYAMHLAPHADNLVEAARTAVDELPPARHTTAWRELLDHLAATHNQIRRILNQPTTPGSVAGREQHATLWPHLAAWAEHGHIAAALTNQHHQPLPAPTEEMREEWSARIRAAAQRRGDLEPVESWYTPGGTPVTLAFVFEGDTDTVVAWTGDPDGPDWRVLDAYDDVDAARRALPRPVPPGVLRPEAARFDRPAHEPEVSLQELLRDITEAQAAGDVAEALLLTAQTDRGAPGPMFHLRELLHTAAEFSGALETVQGDRLTARFDSLAHQLGSLIEQLRTAAEDLGATVAVLPPHRAPRPRPQPPRHPPPGTTPDGASPRGPLPAARRR